MGTTAGIDLGTTNSGLAYVNKAGLPEIVPNAEGEKITPSVVLFDVDTVYVGSIAKLALGSDPGNVVQLIKRQMGSNWTFIHQGVEYRPEQVSALILKKVVRDAEQLIGPIDRAVITVPAYFNDAMRSATRTAGELAGIDVMGLVNEPTAAAIAFGVQTEVHGATALVCDLGGGTFDVTVMRISGRDFEVLATGGDNFLGGANFDKKLYDHFVAEFDRKTGVNVEDPNQVGLEEFAQIAPEWLKRAEDLKRVLSQRPQANTRLTAVGKTLTVEVTRDEFEAMSAVLIQEIEDETRKTLAEAGIKASAVDMVVLVGGATRMPMVRDRVTRFFGKLPSMSINPDEAVALGAALFATTREGGKILQWPGAGPRIKDVASHSLGVQAYDRPPAEGGHLHNATILPRNVSLPFSRSKTFYTSRPGQTSITVQVVEGDDPDLSLCAFIGQLHIDELPAGRPTGMPVVVTMTYNEEGILEVAAVDQATGRDAHVTIRRTAGLPEEEQGEATALVAQLAVK